MRNDKATKAEEWARDRAVGVHNERASQFFDEYNREDSFKSAFRYGRSLIDKRWGVLLSQFPKNAPVLDIGCGTGHYAQAALQRGLDVLAVEPSNEMRERASMLVPPERLSDGSVLALPFVDGQFDFVYQIEVLRYLDSADNIRAHQEIARVTKVGGVYFGTYVNRFALDGYWLKVAFSRIVAAIRGKSPENHVEFETPATLRKKLKMAGFSNVEIHGAMWAPLRIIFKVSPKVAEDISRKMSGMDRIISDSPFVRAFAGHLIVVARR